MKAGFFGSPAGPTYVGSTIASDTGADATLSATVDISTLAFEAGDVAVMVNACDDFSGQKNLSAISADWTQFSAVTSSGSGGQRVKAYYRVLQAGDSTWAIEATDAYNLASVVMVMRGATGIGNYDEATAQGLTGVTIQKSGNAMLVFASGSDASTSTPDWGTGPAETTKNRENTVDQGNYALGLWAGHEVEMQSGATGTREWTGETNIDREHYLLVEIT